MVTPTRKQIEKRAKGLDFMEAIKHGLPTITPEVHELKESGVWKQARDDLMGSRAGPRSAQTQYVHEIASEVGLKVTEWKEHREHMRKVQAFDVFKRKHPQRVKRVNGYRIVFPSLPAPKAPKKVSVRKPKPQKRTSTVTVKVPKRVVLKPKKKRRKSHTERTGKTMRSLAKIKGVNVFSFPDDVWKVKRKRRRK